MTSRNLLCRLMREDVKRRLWAIAISVIAFLFAIPVYTATSLERAIKMIKQGQILGDKQEYLSNVAMNCLSVGNSALVMLTIMLAILCGISGFYYLHSKKKVDFYHSLPVKRESLFTSIYTIGIAIYVIPYLVSLAIGFVIVGTNGVFGSNVWVEAWKAFGVNLLSYCIIYTVVIIAVLLTGQLIVSILACSVFLAYGPVVAVLIGSLKSTYFNTYYEYDSITESLLYRCSPISAYSNMSNAVYKGTLSLSSILIYIAVAIVLVVLAVFIYRKRSSEAAGKAIAYQVLQPYIKIAISVPIGLLSGIIFTSFMNADSSFWLIFGMVCGYLLCSCIMEIIYHFDFKAAFKSRVSLLIGAVLMFAIFSTYKWDLLKYDQYIPSKDKIESMSIALSDIDTNLEFVAYNENDSRNGISYMNGTSYAFEYMNLQDKDVAYEIAGMAVAGDGVLNEEEVYGDREYDQYMSMYVQYRLKSGRHVYRRYTIAVEPYFELLNQLYQSKEYKEGAFPIYRMKEVTNITCYNEFQKLSITLTEEEKVQLLSLYRDELYRLSLENVRNEVPLATIDFSYTTDENNVINYSSLVYPSFTKTIDFLSEHGFDFSKTFDLDDIINVSVDYVIPHYAREEEQYIAYEKEHPDWTYDKNVMYKDSETISKIIPYLVNNSYAWNNGVLSNYDTNLNFTVTWKTDEYGNVASSQYVMDIDNIPDFVKEDIMYTESSK